MTLILEVPEMKFAGQSIRKVRAGTGQIHRQTGATVRINTPHLQLVTIRTKRTLISTDHCDQHRTHIYSGPCNSVNYLGQSKMSVDDDDDDA